MSGRLRHNVKGAVLSLSAEITHNRENDKGRKENLVLHINTVDQRARERILVKNKKIAELSELCASWEGKAKQFQQANKNLENQYSQYSPEVRQEDLQLLRATQSRLQAALKVIEVRSKRCGTLEEELSNQLAESEERHHIELDKRDEDCRRDLSQQAEKFQKELSKREGILQKRLSERNAFQQELQQMMQDKIQLQTSLDEERREMGTLKKDYTDMLTKVERYYHLDIIKRDIIETHLQHMREDNGQSSELVKEKGKKKKKRKCFWRRLFKKKN